MTTTTDYGTVTFEDKTYTLTADVYLSDRVFPNSWYDAADGEGYVSEWEAHAEDADGNEFLVVWQFPATKGEEPENDDEWPWGDDSYIVRVIDL